MQNALGIYAGAVKEDDGYEVDSPANRKQVLIDELEKAISEVTGFLAEQKIDLQEIINASTEDLHKLELLDEASEILLNPNLQDDFAAFVRQINRIAFFPK